MIRRSYHCDVCDTKFEVLCEKDDPDPDCATCSYTSTRDEAEELRKENERLKKMIEEGRAPGVLTHKSRALDYAQEVAEKDYGLTDMRDGGREGEAAFKPEGPVTTAQAHQQAREIMAAVADTPSITPVSPFISQISGSADPVETFWGGAGAVPGRPGAHAAQAASIPPGSAEAAAAARQLQNPKNGVVENRDPVGMLHEGAKKFPLQNTIVGHCPIESTNAA